MCGGDGRFCLFADENDSHLSETFKRKFDDCSEIPSSGSSSNLDASENMDEQITDDRLVLHR